MFKPRQSGNIFKTKIIRAPPPPPEEPRQQVDIPVKQITERPGKRNDDDDGPIYLPGERLAKKLQKQKRTHKKKASTSNSKASPGTYSEDDLVRCQNAINNILQVLQL